MGQPTHHGVDEGAVSLLVRPRVKGSFLQRDVTSDGAVQRIDLLEPQRVKVEREANLTELPSDLCMLGVKRPRHVGLVPGKARKEEHVLGVDVAQDGPLQLIPLTLYELCVVG
jgi:hypothetical protein